MSFPILESQSCVYGSMRYVNAASQEKKNTNSDLSGIASKETTSEVKVAILFYYKSGFSHPKHTHKSRSILKDDLAF